MIIQKKQIVRLRRNKMACITCDYFKAITNEEGEVEPICSKFNKEVFAFGKCIATKKFLKEERTKKIYLDNYKTASLDEIARMARVTKNQLTYLVSSNGLPKKWGL